MERARGARLPCAFHVEAGANRLPGVDPLLWTPRGFFQSAIEREERRTVPLATLTM